MKHRQASEQGLSFLSGKWADHEQWRITAKAKVTELLSYSPVDVPLDAQTVSTAERDGYIQHEVLFNTSGNVRVAGSLLIPMRGKRPFPAVIALHDHSGYYDCGREKLIEQQPEPESLANFKRMAYGGRSWASELARRGFAVLSIDSFYFGSRKLMLGSVSDDMHKRYHLDSLESHEPGSPEYIGLYNHLCGLFETLTMRSILAAGATWPGIMLHDDRKSIDFLLTREEVDPGRIGCCGLSLGGMRSYLLAGLDGRMKASVVAGWMTTAASMLDNRCRDQSDMVYIPGLTALMDIPDLASLSAPNAMLVQQCSRDDLYNLKGMEDACDKIGAIYGKLGLSDRFQAAFYDNGHEFNLKMQEEAFQWLEKWLRS